MAKYRAYVFTYNNPAQTPEQLIGLFTALPCFRYVTFQKEVGETGTEHYQGYLELTMQQRFSYIINRVAQMHLEPRRGTQEQAITYCTKDDTRIAGPWQAGTPAKQGQRNDILGYVEAIVSGKRKRDLISSHPIQMARFDRFYSIVQHSIKRRRRPNLKVILLYGETGTGKTRFVHDHYFDLWQMPPSSGKIWFTGYDGQKTALLDDFAGKLSHVSLTYTLNILDIYPVCCEIKGSHIWFEPDRIFITTNMHPRDWYDFSTRMEQYCALLRRITQVWYFRRGDLPEEILMETYAQQQEFGDRYF